MKTSLRRAAAALASAGAIVASLLVATPASAAPFSDAEAMVYLAQASPTQLSGGSQLSGELRFQNIGGPAAITYNAVGYNEQDNFIYGVGNGYIIRIHSNGAVQNVKAAAVAAHVGAFRASTAEFWYTNGARLFRTNLAVAGSASTEVALSRNFPAADFTWAGGYFWGMGGGQIHRLSTTGVVTSFPAPARLSGYNAGGAWTYGNGNLGFTDNATGDISQVRVTNPAAATPTFTVVSVISGPPSSNNDATSSMGSPADLAISKRFAQDRVKPGGDASFALTITNNGAGVSSGFTVSDRLPGALTGLELPAGCSVSAGQLTCSGGRLEVGASVTFTIGARIAANATSGSIQNTATVLGNESDAIAANNTASDSITVELSTLTIVKTGELDDVNGNGVPDVGEMIRYGFAVSNPGTTDLTGVAVTDPRAVDLSPSAVDLAAGGTTRFTGSRTVTQADIDSGSVDNTATASGTDDFGDVITSAPSSWSVAAPPEPALEAIKSAELVDANGNGAADENETIRYVVTVTNTGNVTLDAVSVEDAIVTLTPERVTLAPGASQDYAGEYLVSAQDVANGQVRNTATASGTSPDGATVQSPPSSTVTPTADIGLTLVKSGEFEDTNGNGLLDGGERIQYSFVVTNTGNVDIREVTVEDPRVTGITPASADIPAGEQVIFTADPYVVTDEDVQNTRVVNEATASGMPLGGAERIETDPSSVTIPTVDPVASWVLDKRADLEDVNGNGLADAGEIIRYSFLATNTGTLTLTDVAVDDPKVTGISPVSARLIPGQRVLFTADPYTVTQADVDSGAVENEATGTGRAPDGAEIIPPPSATVVDVPQAAPALRAVKSGQLADANGNGVADAGEVIDYAVVVTNSGNVTLSDVSVDDPKAGAMAPVSVASLAPRESVRFTASPYIVTEEDVATGVVRNTATAAGTAPDSARVQSPPSSTEVETVRPGLTLGKSAELSDANGNGVADVGETITYTFEATNTGNTRLEDVAVDDPRVEGVQPASARIDAGRTQLFVSAPYTVTEEDILAGGDIVNTATATGTVPGGAAITTPPASAAVAAADVAEGLVLEKNGLLDDANGNGVADLGETVAYVFVATNTGNVTLRGVSVTDDRVSSISPVSADIAPGASETFAAEAYRVSQADIDAGRLVNVATAAGRAPSGNTVGSERATHSLPVSDPVAALVTDKRAELVDGNGNAVADEGESIRYTIVVTNRGNVTLHDVRAHDAMLTGLTPASIDSLAPGAEAVFTADPYVVTRADVDRGVILNSARATGSTPSGGETQSPPATVSTPTVDPGMLMKKLATLEDLNGNGMADLGERITYAFAVTNTGNTRIENVSIDDPRVVRIAPASATLLVGEQVVFTADPYLVTEDDIVAGEITNTATATGSLPGGGEITTPPSTVSVSPAPVSTQLAVDKEAAPHDADGDGVLEQGESISYRITVTNTGNVTLTDVAIVDAKLAGLTPSRLASLAPGASVTATADAYVVTAADAARGSVENQAAATATGPSGEPVQGRSEIVRTYTGGLAATGVDGAPIVVLGAAALLLAFGAALIAGMRRRARLR
ncbi:DUF11 domain-containing protein [Microbacterium sp. Marseille-Q6965]|uniref:DUF11 domain-containing protein n=1 Tax=Microbacterium sp. Marseille-Q6965 TaxID=2965072 RepID=UPI0021B7BD60|nr:DUF11 domain-containing protein [Microbacterium sp. Marseille-Q6965]